MEKALTYFDTATKELLKPKPDVTSALELMQKAHELGFPKASYAIATWYLHGKYYKTSIKKGVQLLKIAVKGKVSEACFDLAVCYETGNGIPKNLNKAFEYYLRSALSGDKEAVVAIGRCYYYGIGTIKSKILSNIWLDKAEELGAKW